MKKIISIFKSSLKLITILIPESALARIASGIAIWAVESLVKNSKSTVDDKVLEIVKDELKSEK